MSTELSLWAKLGLRMLYLAIEWMSTTHCMPVRCGVKHTASNKLLYCLVSTSGPGLENRVGDMRSSLQCSTPQVWKIFIKTLLQDPQLMMAPFVNTQ